MALLYIDNTIYHQTKQEISEHRNKSLQVDMKISGRATRCLSTKLLKQGRIREQIGNDDTCVTQSKTWDKGERRHWPVSPYCLLTHVSFDRLGSWVGQDTPPVCDDGTYGRGDTRGSAYVSDICRTGGCPPACHVYPVCAPSDCSDLRRTGDRRDISRRQSYSSNLGRILVIELFTLLAYYRKLLWSILASLHTTQRKEK